MDQDKQPRPLERRVFREEIREKLIEDILNGRLAPGSRIVETRIAQQFGVSQGPVREALRDLELFGFVVSSPFRGTQVRKISTEELLEIYPIRAALEGVAARAAAVRIDQATLEHLEELIGVMREAAARDDHPAEADADHSFHHAIVKASGNRMLEHVWQTMRLSITTCLTSPSPIDRCTRLPSATSRSSRRCVPAIPTGRSGDQAPHRRARRVGSLRTSAGAGRPSGGAGRERGV